MHPAPRPFATRCVVIAALAGLFSATPAEAKAPLRLVICHPGGPDLAEEQQNVVEKMYRYIEKQTSLEKGAIEGLYTNIHDECLAALGKQPGIVIPSLPVYLEHKDKFGLLPVAQLKIGGKVEDHFYVMVKKDSAITSIDQLAGKKISGTHVASPGFVVGVVLESKLKKKDATLVPKKFGLRAIREVTKGKADAVLLDGFQYRALAGTRFEKKLRLLHTSQALPTPPITIIPKNTPAGYGPKIGRALVGMTDDPEGREVVRLFRIEGFEHAAPKTWASLEKRIKSAP